MAEGNDSSKYRNPDMPADYEKKELDLQYKIGLEVNGVRLETPTVLAEDDIIRDDGNLSDLILSNDEKDVKDNGSLSDAIVISDDEKDLLFVAERPSTSQISKKIKKCSSFDSERTGKKGYDSCDISAYEKKRTEPSSRKRYRSDSNGSTLRHSSSSPDCRPNKKTHSHSRMDIDRQKYENKYRAPWRKSYRSDSSSSSSRHDNPLPSYKPRNKSSYTQPSLPNVKRESCVQPQHTSGNYHCHICDMNLNSILSYNAHVNGKRHSKNLKNKNIAQAIAQGIPISASTVPEELSKYPKPLDGVLRKMIKAPAKIQHIIEEKVKRPCIGLETVTEIQGLTGVQYYCSLCNMVCFSDCIISHLVGQNHMRRSAGKYHPNYKEIISATPKLEKEKKVVELLREIQSNQGMGKMAVEVEEYSKNTNSGNKVNRFSKAKIYSYQPGTSKDVKVQPTSSRYYQNEASTSKETGSKFSNVPFHKLCDKASLPNKSGSDFYCRVCQSHMNSQQMWEAHVKGRRHLTNLKKLPGDVPSKMKTVPIPNRKAVLLDRLKVECPQDPIVGLELIQEIEMPIINTYNYKCFLCGSCLTMRDIIEHLISLKHRFKYLNHISFPGRSVARNMSEDAAYTLVHEMCLQAEVQRGRGEPQVHLLRSLMF